MALVPGTDPGDWAELSPPGALSPGLTQPVGTLQVFAIIRSASGTPLSSRSRKAWSSGRCWLGGETGDVSRRETGRTIAGTGIHPTPNEGPPRTRVCSFLVPKMLP